MKHALATISVLGAAVLAGLVASACAEGRAATSAPAAGNAGAAVQRGQYLVSVIGCSDCHTPLKMGPKGPEPDLDRFLSGHPEQIGPLPAAGPQGPWLWAGAATNTAFTGPWGVSYAANLTPDRNTGLGIWDETMFVRAIRTGRHMGTSREILPPMPWPAFRNATDEDLKAIYAYLRSLKPVVNHVPDVQPPTGGPSSN
jgi:mono/diheme cytochrome c family protein